MTKPNKRDEIVRSALELIAEHGFHGAPMAMIAEHAGVGAGTIYRYFENKDVLISELYQSSKKNCIRSSWRAMPPKPLSGCVFSISARHCCAISSNIPCDFRYLEQFHNSPYGVDRPAGQDPGENGRLRCFQGAVRTGGGAAGYQGFAARTSSSPWLSGLFWPWRGTISSVLSSWMTP